MKRNRTPFPLRVIQWVFPKLEVIAPKLAHRCFVKIFFSPFRYPIPEKEKAYIDKSEKFTFRIKGKRIQGYRWGSGPAVVVVHGWAGRATQFRKFIDALNANGFQVIGFDGPAHGFSEGKNTDVWEFEEALRWIFSNIAQPVAVIAHSYGGAAVLCSAMNGLRVPKLINISSPTIADEILRTYLRTINGSKPTGEAFKTYFRSRYGKPYEEATAMYFVQHLPQPIDLLLINDEQDQEAKMVNAEELQRVYPSAKLIRTSGLGHTRILKDDTVVAKCLDFIKAP